MIDHKKAFALIPLTENFDDVYLVIRKAVASLEDELGIPVQVFRADEITKPGRVSQQILEAIREADAVIADVTGNDPNVMYELGFAHAANRPVVMISQQLSGTPFDLSDTPRVVYDRSRLVNDLAPRLTAALTKIFAGVSDTRPTQAIETSPGSGNRTSVHGPVALTPEVLSRIQRDHLRLQMASKEDRRSEIQAIAAELYQTLDSLVVEKDSGHELVNSIAAVSGNCAVQLERAGLSLLAGEVYRRALGLFPAYAGLHLQYGDFLADEGRLSEAEAEFARAKELDPEDSRLNHLALKLAIRSGRSTEDLSEKLFKAFHAEPQRRDSAATLLSYLSSTDAPQEEFEAVCRKWEDALPDGEKWVARRALADYLASKSSGDDSAVARAESIYRDLLEKDPDPSERYAVLHNLASLLASRGQNDDAKKFWLEAYSLRPFDQQLRAALSQRLAQWGDLQSALIVADGRPLEDNPTTPETIQSSE